MKGESDVVAHVVAATGVAEAEVRRVVDAAFGFLKASAMAGEGIVHPSLGAIRPRQREKDGVTKTVFRFVPDANPGPGKAGRGAGGAGGGAKRAGGGAAGRKGGGGGRRKHRGTAGA